VSNLPQNAGNAISERLYSFNFFLLRVCLASSNQTNLRMPMYRSTAVHCKYMHVAQHEHEALYIWPRLRTCHRGVLDLYIYKFIWVFLVRLVDIRWENSD
jgi:hypothetical protein